MVFVDWIDTDFACDFSEALVVTKGDLYLYLRVHTVLDGDHRSCCMIVSMRLCNYMRHV